MALVDIGMNADPVHRCCHCDRRVESHHFTFIRGKKFHICRDCKVKGKSNAMQRL